MVWNAGRGTDVYKRQALVLAAAFVTGMLAGGLAGGVTGFLKAKLNINEVLVCLLYTSDNGGNKR